MIWSAALLIGYLIGSISGARIIAGVRMPGADVTSTRVVLDGTGTHVTGRGVSPSSIQARMGGRGGIPAAAIDILKAVLVVLATQVAGPGPATVAAASGVMVGHVFPLFHRFVGGYGVSPLLGVLAVLDWTAIPVTIVAMAIVGLALGSAYLGIETWPVALLPWFAWRGDLWLLGFALLVNVLYWWRSWPEAVAAYRSWRADRRPWRQRVRDFARYPDYEPPS